MNEVRELKDSKCHISNLEAYKIVFYFGSAHLTQIVIILVRDFKHARSHITIIFQATVFSVFKRAHTETGAHPSSYSMGTGRFLSVGKAAGT
jgi:hypothetical protein